MASVLEEILLEEYDRSARMVRALDDELASLVEEAKGGLRVSYVYGQEHGVLR